MLNAKELKTVVSTLAQRRAWLRKSLESGDLDQELRDENLNSLKLLDSAISKLAAAAPPSKAQSKFPSKTSSSPVKSALLEPAECRVLIAEDTEDSANLLRDIVENMGINQIELAKDGVDAFDCIRKASPPYHLILCDWEMPGLSGIEVHAKAQASNTLRGAHFMMVTATSEAARIKAALQQGINDYIVKPIDVEKLRTKIRAAITFKA